MLCTELKRFKAWHRALTVVQSYLLINLLSIEAHCSIRVNVVIRPGQPRNSINNHIREIAIILRGVEDYDKIARGAVEIYEDENRTKKLDSFNVSNHIQQRFGNSLQISTTLIFAQTNFSAQNAPKGCLNYTTTLSVDGEQIAKGCLKTQPSWMIENVDIIGDFALRELALPGSHDSGAYEPYSDDEIYILWYRDCQEESIFTQLLYGARFFDLRPGSICLPEEQCEFYIFHAILPTTNKLETVLNDVKSFVELFPNEIVILDMHRFPVGFESQKIFDIFADLIEKLLGPVLIRGDIRYLTYNQILRTNQRVIVTFNANDVMEMRYNPGVQNIWANTVEMPSLEKYFKQHLPDAARSQWFYSAMAELTPSNPLDALFDRFHGGVRALSDRNNFNVTSWFVEKLDNQTGDTNPIRQNAAIVAVDFFAGTDLTDICIDINRERTKLLTREKKSHV